MGRKWVGPFNDGRTNVHYDVLSGQSSVVNNGWAEKANETIEKNRWFTIRLLCDESFYKELFSHGSLLNGYNFL
ncbi:hypothetical protein TNCV_558641 [Trichonephila clavipes]|nr:hypothetical protein TNCV_558641 [Trichonephila clavipes]